MTETAATDRSIRKRLGRGLGSLLSAPVKVDLPAQLQATQSPDPSAGQDTVAQAVPRVARESADGSVVQMMDLSKIHPNPHQPRQHFDEDALTALANSIKTSGVMQPIVVRPAGSKSKLPAGEFQIIAGERRWRAAQLAGLKAIPALVRDIDDRIAAELSLVENLQREDLNPIERAEAFRRLMEEFRFTHQEIAERVGLERSSVTNHLRLNDLDEFCKDAIRYERLTMGHAKVLLGITNFEQQQAIAKDAVREGWSVRELERRVAQLLKGGNQVAAASSSPQQKPHPVSPNVADLERNLAQVLGTKVQLRPGAKKGTGKITIEFYSLDQFEDLLRLLGLKTE